MITIPAPSMKLSEHQALSGTAGVEPGPSGIRRTASNGRKPGELLAGGGPVVMECTRPVKAFIVRRCEIREVEN